MDLNLFLYNYYIMSDVLSKIPDDDNTEIAPPKVDEKQVSVMDIPITDENSALNVMVTFLGVAQKRGAFAINESAKIFECIQIFKKNSEN